MIDNPASVFGPAQPYVFHVKVRSGSAVRDVVMTEQQWTECTTRAERAPDELPQLATRNWLKLLWRGVQAYLRARIIPLLLLLLVLTGCTATQSKIHYGPVTIGLPKDAHWDWMQIVYKGSNDFTITISNATFRMNPEVIDAKSRANAEMFRLGAETAGTIINKASGLPSCNK